MSHLVSRDLIVAVYMGPRLYATVFLFMYITGDCKVAYFQVSVFKFVVLLFDLHCRL